MHRLSLTQAQWPLMLFQLTYVILNSMLFPQCNQRISSASVGGPSIGNPDYAQLEETSLVSPSHAVVRE